LFSMYCAGVRPAGAQGSDVGGNRAKFRRKYYALSGLRLL
jgi:hypothetical protein